mgnify:CR=1 FL=1
MSKIILSIVFLLCTIYTCFADKYIKLSIEYSAMKKYGLFVVDAYILSNNDTLFLPKIKQNNFLIPDTLFKMQPNENKDIQLLIVSESHLISIQLDYKVYKYCNIISMGIAKSKTNKRSYYSYYESCKAALVYTSPLIVSKRK